MRSMQFISVVAVLALGTACRQDATDANAANAGDAANPAVEQASPAEQAGPQQDTTRMGQAAGARRQVIDGPLANDPGFQMPVPGAATPASPADTPAIVQLDADTVRVALLEGMPESGDSIRVQTSPRGNVTLSGEVATIADRQRAHYLARALPGVAEVDIRGLRVR